MPWWTNQPGGQAVFKPDGYDETQGKMSDAAWVSGDGTVVSILKKIAGASGGGGGAVTVADGADVALGTTTDASSVSTVVGLLKAVKTAVQGVLLVGGDVASAAADSGNPVKIGAVNRTTKPTFTDGQRAEAQMDTRGNLQVALVGLNGTTGPVAGTPADASNPGAALFAESAAMVYNGTGWDRARGNFNAVTGDTGAKVATFNGATISNFNLRGAFITILLGTVSGTTPTMSCQLQFSPDGGTTFINIGPALPNLTTTGQSGLFMVYPTRLSQTPGTTPADLTSGASVQVALNMPLPRTWRIVYTIAGTSPSFTISSVNVSGLV